MGMQRRSVPKRTLVPLLVLHWRAKDGRATQTVQKSDLLDQFRFKDLEVEEQYKDIRRQLNEYDRSREPEVRGKWNKVCGQCGYVNHERHRYCESCGCSMTVQPNHQMVHVCPKCRAEVPKHVRECGACGARFWSPIILSRLPEDECPSGDEEAR